MQDKDTNKLQDNESIIDYLRRVTADALYKGRMEKMNEMTNDCSCDGISEDLQSKILIAIGKASMCWAKIENAGVFDSEQAKKVANDLCCDIEGELNSIKMPETHMWNKLKKEINSWITGGQVSIEMREAYLSIYKMIEKMEKET